MRRRRSGRGRWTARVVVAVLAAAALTGCRDELTPLGPDNDLTVINETGSFRLRATGLDDVSDIRSYEWQAGAGSQVVTQGAGITAGYAYLTVTDPSGAEVYGRSLSETGTYQTEPGTAGAWTVSLFLERVSGTLDVTVQSP